MKKLGLVLCLTALVVFALPVFAKGPSTPAGNSNKAHLYLYEKNPSTWQIVEKGAWGKMTYDLSGSMFNYVFNGHNMVSEGDYTLIYYPDPWPGTGLKCLGTGTADKDGNTHIANSVSTGNLPMESDDNDLGAKIWLVKSEDVNCEVVTWNVVGTYKWLVLGTYEHDLVITSQNPDGTFVGYGGYPAGGVPYDQSDETTETITGYIEGNEIHFTTVYGGLYNPGYTATVSGTIAPDGSMSGIDPFEWHTTSGNAASSIGKMVGWNPTEYLFEEVLIKFEQK